MTEHEKTIAQLDRDYQLAVKNHVLSTIKRIHADDMVLVLGSGKVATGVRPGIAAACEGPQGRVTSITLANAAAQ